MSDYKYKASLALSINDGIKDGYPDNVIVRKLFCYEKPIVLNLDDFQAIGFSIFNEVSDQFSIPLRSIYVSGSAQTGYSYIKKKDFEKKLSDLDLAIVDTMLFKEYLDIVFNVTERYTNNILFDNVDSMKNFKNYAGKGIIKPELMPNIQIRNDWEKFFNDISSRYSDYFKSINCCIYLSDVIYEWKQASLIKAHRGGLL